MFSNKSLSLLHLLTLIYTQVVSIYFRRQLGAQYSMQLIRIKGAEYKYNSDFRNFSYEMFLGKKENYFLRFENINSLVFYVYDLKSQQTILDRRLH